MQAPLELINLLSKGVPMAEAKQRLGLEPAPETLVAAGVSGEHVAPQEATEPAVTTPSESDETDEEAPAPSEAKPAWMP